MLDRIRNVMLQAWDVREAQIQLLRVVLFGKFQDFFRTHRSSMSGGLKTVGILRYRDAIRIPTGVTSVNTTRGSTANDDFAELVARKKELEGVEIVEQFFQAAIVEDLLGFVAAAIGYQQGL